VSFFGTQCIIQHIRETWQIFLPQEAELRDQHKPTQTEQLEILFPFLLHAASSMQPLGSSCALSIKQSINQSINHTTVTHSKYILLNKVTSLSSKFNKKHLQNFHNSENLQYVPPA